MGDTTWLLLSHDGEGDTGRMAADTGGLEFHESLWATALRRRPAGIVRLVAATNTGRAVALTDRLPTTGLRR